MSLMSIKRDLEQLGPRALQKALFLQIQGRNNPLQLLHSNRRQQSQGMFLARDNREDQDQQRHGMYWAQDVLTHICLEFSIFEAKPVEYSECGHKFCKINQIMCMMLPTRERFIAEKLSRRKSVKLRTAFLCFVLPNVAVNHSKRLCKGQKLRIKRPQACH